MRFQRTALDSPVGRSHDHRYNIRLGIAVCGYLVALPVRLILQARMPDVPLNVTYGLSILLAVQAVPILLRRWKTDMLLAGVAAALVYAVSYAVYPNNRDAINEVLPYFLVICIPMYWIGRAITQPALLLSCMRVASYVLIPVMMLNHMFWGTDIEKRFQLAQTLSYLLLPAACTCGWLFLRRGRLIDLAAAIGASIHIVLFGARGASVSIGVLVALYAILYRRSQPKRAGAAAVFLVSVGVVVFANQARLIDVLLQDFGESNRTARLVREGRSVADLSGRDDLWREFLDLLLAHPITGLGVGGDRATVGFFAHNVVLEIMLDYGVVCGTVVTCLLGMTLAKGFRRSRSGPWRDVLCIMFVLSIPKLIVSSSYWSCAELTLLLGLSRSALESPKEFVRTGGREGVTKKERLDGRVAARVVPRYIESEHG